MQEARNLVNSWLYALHPDRNLRLDDENRLDLAPAPERPLSLYLDDTAGRLHWALPIYVTRDNAPLSDAQLTHLAALNHLQEATRGARLALIDKPDRVQLLYCQALSHLDQNRFINITGELIATATALTTQLAAHPNDPAFHPSV